MLSSAESLIPLLDADEELDEQTASVLDAAMAAFLDFGVRRTSMGEIARRAGVSQATLYRWFGCKDDIVAAVVVREARTLLATLHDAVDGTGNAEQQFADGMVILARRLRDHPLLNRLKVTEPESILPFLTVDGAGLLEIGTAYLATLIARAQSDGLFVDIDPAPFAELIVRVVHSLTITPSTALPLGDDETLRAVAGTAARLLLHNAGPPDGPTTGG